MGLISKERAIQELVNDYAYAAAKIIEDIPAVDAKIVGNAQWVNAAGCRTICNHCGEYPLYDYFGRQKFSRFCPSCGFDMGGGETCLNQNL